MSHPRLLLSLGVVAMLAAGAGCGGPATVTTGHDAGTAIDAGGGSSGGSDGGIDGGNSGGSDAGSGGSTLPTLNIDDVQHAEGTSGTTAFTFTVSLDRAPAEGEDVQVSWATADGTAVAGSDYAAASGTLTFTKDGELTQQVTVQVDGDTELEPDETFSVVLTNPVHATLGKATGTGTISADDFPTLSIAPASAPEGDSGTSPLAFTVTLSAAPIPGYPVTVGWMTADATARAGEDYEASTGTVSFEEGGLTQSLSVPVIGDTTIEPDETFIVALTNPQHASLGTVAAIGTILADDFPHASVSDAQAVEGGPGESRTMTFTISLDASWPAGYAATMDWSTVDGTALAGSDYLPASGTLSFGPGMGSTSQTVSVTLLGDADIEEDELFSIVLANPVNVSFAKARGDGKILNDDWPSLAITGVTAPEGNAGTTDFAFTVSISAVPLDGQTATVHWTAHDGSAIAGQDFVPSSGDLTFAPGGGLTQTIHVPVIADTVQEPDENFSVELSAETDATVSVRNADGIIQNDDFPTATIADASVLEGSGSGTTNLVFTVTLDELPLAGQDAQVTWTTSDGTATSPADYTASSGTLTFTAAGGLTQTVSVPIARDTAVEPDETFAVTLANPTKLQLGTKASATGTILADDFPTVSIADVSAYEGDSGTTDFAFAITLSAAPPAGYPLAIDWATHDGTATSPSDYAAASGTVTFAPGDALTKNVVVKVNGDTIPEPDETFTVGLANPVHGTFARATATGTIRNDEAPAASITDASVKEGDFGTNELVFVVSVDNPPMAGFDAKVGWATSDGTATAGSDYVASSGTLTFTAGGPLSQRITVPVIGDTVREGTETFFVNLTAQANVRLKISSGTGTIIDDELPALSINDVTHLEGAAGATTPYVFTVSISAPPAPGQDVDLVWTTVNLSAFAGTDYQAGSGTLRFTATTPTTANLTVNVPGNATIQLQRQFEVVLRSVTNATVLDGTGLGTIVDDDGALIRVDASATGTADGLTWATAYPTLQAGVDRASALGGGQVWVAAGTYTNGGGTGPVLTMKNLVSVIGGFDGWRGGSGAQETQITSRDPVAHVTTLDGQSSAYHVIIGASAVLDGFTVTGGNANSNATTNDYDPGRRGGGLDLTSGSMQIANCVFRNNYAAGNGGAINASTTFTAHDTKFLNNTSNNGGAVYTTALINLFDDLIQGNYAGQFTLGGGYGGGVQDQSQATSTYTNVTFDTNHGTYGGGLHMTFGKCVVRNCTFTNNLAQGSLGAAGGGFYDDSWSASQVYDSVFLNNKAGDDGAGMELRDSNTIVSGCRIEGNTANYGAGIFLWNYFGGTSQIFNTRVAYNRSSYGGGGAYLLQSSPVFVNAVFEGNEGGSRGGALYDVGSSPTLVNSDFVNDNAATGPEIDNEVYGGSPAIPSNPVMANSILLNRSIITPAVANNSGSLSATNSLSSDNGKDPHFNHVALHVSSTGSGSSAAVLNVGSANSLFAVGDVVEVGNDSVARKVIALTTASITISPALSAAPTINTHVENWGPNATDLNTDLRLRADSPCIDAGNNGAMKADAADVDHDGNTTELVPLDFAKNPRFVDDPTVADTGTGTAPLIDIGAYERPAP